MLHEKNLKGGDQPRLLSVGLNFYSPSTKRKFRIPRRSCPIPWDKSLPGDQILPACRPVGITGVIGQAFIPPNRRAFQGGCDGCQVETHRSISVFSIEQVCVVTLTQGSRGFHSSGSVSKHPIVLNRQPEEIVRRPELVGFSIQFVLAKSTGFG